MAKSPQELRDLAWSQVQDLVERQLRPLGDLALSRLQVMPGDHVLDIGCGAGRTLLSLAHLVGHEGSVTGLDVSELMSDRARALCADLSMVEIVCADAQTHEFRSGNFDAAYSRFGVMFFDDPVAAFANIRRGMRPGGHLAFVCWRALVENELDLAPHMAAAPVLPSSLLEQTGLARSFSFADREVLGSIMKKAGFEDIRIEAHDQEVSSGDLASMLEVSLKVGSLGSLLREHPEYLEAARPRVEAMLKSRVRDGGCFLTAAIWVATARSVQTG